ncbi:cytochrome P450 [Pleomassaria siparia CBS 279.74]|uniref:Cytochrome P450 n=1 Tax=Pleomassaria siparia CBS 279.74 TaxID=1314801 RepID=A0A6G1KLM9_9PLEO|nr:cytochrome P450 [Pleomassaria siparia CBS 279.74]
MVFRYQSLASYFRCHKPSKNVSSTPPTFPSYLPIIGNLPLLYLWNPRSFVLSPTDFFQSSSSHPTHVKILHKDLYIVQGASNIVALFRASSLCTSIPFVKYAVFTGFGLPKRAAKLFDLDNSGPGHVPHLDSNVDPLNRIDYRVHTSMVRLLTGDGFAPFWGRFMSSVTKRLTQRNEELSMRVGKKEEQRDLIQFVADEAMGAFLEAMCGPHLLRLCPNFLEEFWEFDRGLPSLLKGMPWLFAPRAHAARKKVLKSIRLWQAHARDNFTSSVIHEDGDDEFWGSRFIRDRHVMFLEMKGYDHEAVASQDLGAIWAARNSITATCWTVYELFRDPNLLSKVRVEVESCVKGHAGKHIIFDIDKLMKMPTLQSVYAEILRLRMHFYIIRMGDRADLPILPYGIPKQQVVVTSTTVAHMNSTAFNTGIDNEHPVDKFWGGRFLTYPNGDSDMSAVFSIKCLEGSWIPYGGGPRQCPGRLFAKRQILLTTALMTSLFDCKIQEDADKDLGEDLRAFSMGVAHPASKVLVRIRSKEGHGV